MIEQVIEIDAWRALQSEQPSLLEHAARMCISAGMPYCAVFIDDDLSFPLATAYASAVPLPLQKNNLGYDQTIEAARSCDFALRQYPIPIDGSAHALALFGESTESDATSALAPTALALFASAIVQTKLLAHHSRVSNRLQRALLPSHLVQGADVAFDAAYIPASNEAEVGGDWYDTFDLSNGCIGVSIGDVTGHGLDAAVTMSEIRHAIRAAASTNLEPTELLDAVDAMVAGHDIGLASAVYGIYDPATGVIRYASAGHPPPVYVTAKGSAYTLQGGGSLIGLGLEKSSHAFTVTLSPGASCVFYTDGLIENERDVISGEEALLNALEAVAAESSLSGVTIHERVLTRAPRDDCATLVISRNPASRSSRERYTFSAVPSSARLLRDVVRDFIERAGIRSDEQFAIVVAAGEAIANAIEHGSDDLDSQVIVELEAADVLTMVIESHGHWRTASSDNRGRGISIMREYAEQVQISSTSERTRVTLIFKVA